jgi:hypothetical protein
MLFVSYKTYICPFDLQDVEFNILGLGSSHVSWARPAILYLALARSALAMSDSNLTPNLLSRPAWIPAAPFRLCCLFVFHCSFTCVFWGKVLPCSRLIFYCLFRAYAFFFALPRVACFLSPRLAGPSPSCSFSVLTSPSSFPLPLSVSTVFSVLAPPSSFPLPLSVPSTVMFPSLPSRLLVTLPFRLVRRRLFCTSCRYV